MKIAILISRLDQTGMSTNTIDLSLALSSLGHDVSLIVGDYHDIGDELLYQKKLLEKSPVRILSVRLSHKNKWINKFTNLLGVFKMMTLLLTKNYNIIHIESPYLTFIPWLLNRRFVSTLHVPDLENIWAYKNATRVIAISNETKDYCMSKFNYNEDQIDLVYHGVSERFSDPISYEEKECLKKKHNISKDDIVIGIVASIEKRKGHDLLIKAIEGLPENIRNSIKLLILGSYKSGSNNWLEGLISTSGIKNQIIWEQYQDPKPFYDILDIFVLPSRLEGFPLVVIEAMLSGCLVIRSDTEGASEQIIDGVNGYIFENENTEDLKNKLLSILKDKDKITSMANASKQYAIDNFTNIVMAKNTIKTYSKLQI